MTAIYTKGTVCEASGSCGTDYCLNSVDLREYYCYGGLLDYTDVGCRTDCEDSDGGQDFFTKGTVTDYKGCSDGACQKEEYEDTCSGNAVEEYYCDGGSAKYTLKSCDEFDGYYKVDDHTLEYRDYKCSDGRCTYTVDPTKTKVCDETTHPMCEEVRAYDSEGNSHIYYCTKGSDGVWRWYAEDELPSEVCSDGVNNDCDTHTDCYDPECYYKVVDRDPSNKECYVCWPSDRQNECTSSTCPSDKCGSDICGAIGCVEGRWEDNYNGHGPVCWYGPCRYNSQCDNGCCTAEINEQPGKCVGPGIYENNPQFLCDPE